jgi:2-polyprenyl-6-methoxyphenol hydroxylase-like FAD-dependent oxidoreductase
MRPSAGGATVRHMSTAHHPRPEAPLDCQVLVVGAGPTGLVLAAELLARGVSTRIIDKGDGVALESRALAIHAGTLEMLQTMGVVGRFLDRGTPVRRFNFCSDGRPFGYFDMSRSGSAFRFMLAIPQHVTERLLRDRVAELGGSIEQGTVLLGLVDIHGGVAASVRDATGVVRTITAGYVAGCDGAHSRVRGELGLPFEGHPYPQDWLLADVRLDWDRPTDGVHGFFRSDGAPLLCFPLPGGIWRLVAPFAGERAPGAPTLEEMQAIVDSRAPLKLQLSDPSWLATFQCHRRSTNTYRRGRVVLAGDAVHIHTPAGGQGMNTGMMDAHNLGWKLALVAGGEAPEGLLDTYGEERGPVARQVLQLTHGLVRFGTLTVRWQRRARDLTVPLLSRTPPVQRRAARRMAQMHVSYRGSQLAESRHPWRGPRPGDRAPNIPITVRGVQTTLHAVLNDRRHVLVIREIQPDDAAASLHLERLAPELDVVTGTIHPSRSLVLVRPDGYVAAVARPRAARPIREYLRSVFDGTSAAPASARSAAAPTAHQLA